MSKYEELLKQMPMPLWVERTRAYNWIGAKKANAEKIAVLVCGLDREGLGRECQQRSDDQSDLIAHSVNMLPRALEALKAIEPYINTRENLLGNAQLNDGVATKYDSACERVREAIQQIENPQ